MAKADQVNTDELNCPACDAQPLMEVFDFDSDEITDGVQIACLSCGFAINSASPKQAEIAVRTLWEYMPEADDA